MAEEIARMQNVSRLYDGGRVVALRDVSLSVGRGESLEQVGSYALGIAWSDGHWQGIYTWQYLYDACL